MGKRKLGGRYQLGRTLGVGAFGKVKCATNLKTKGQVAIKILNKADIKKHGLINSVRTEVTALQLIPPHKHIVNLIEVLDSESKLYLVLELVVGGELFDMIKVEGKLDDATSRHYFRQLISALEFMHQRKICHRDLKLENLLVDKNGCLKVTDFGLSGLHTGSGGDDEVFKTTLGSPNYVAPEVLIGKGYNGFKADIWSTGVILYVLLAGFLPFDEDNAPELFNKICTADFRYPQNFSNTVIDLLNNILNVDPIKRFNIDLIKKHEWFQSNDENDVYYEQEEELIINGGSPQIKGFTQIETPNNKSSVASPKKMWNENDNKRKSLQIRLDKFNDDDEAKYDDVMKQYPSANNSNICSSTNTTPNTNTLFIADNTSDYSDYATSDFESIEVNNSNNEDQVNNVEPISMTAFDLIGIVSTQMLNNVFTRSLQVSQDGDDDSHIEPTIKTYTRFVSGSTPPKILYAIQEAVHRMADCQCRVSYDRYSEIKVIKRKGHRTIHINIQIFKTPKTKNDQYMIELRRTRGNIFRYHEFFDEFKLKYENVIKHLDKNPKTINKTQKQIKFRDSKVIIKNRLKSKTTKSKGKGHHNRSISLNINKQANINNEEIIDNISMNELSASQSNPNDHHHQHQPKQLSNLSSASQRSSISSQQSATSTNTSPTPSTNEVITQQQSNSFSENSNDSFDDASDNIIPQTRQRTQSSGTYGISKTGHLDIPQKVSEN